ncbi:Gfo/Idh/MocA family protein [Actinokineospora sp.]|uniref:Gfo/Idh/MocA family protein n=1 Tax=Actinokineospora sp. TaxID=1872133 RepID=UPI0040379169
MVRFGVLGCSSIARRRFLPALARSSARLTAVASRDPGRAAAFAAEFDCAPVPGYDALLARDDIDAVYVSVPTGLHTEWARAALAAGKHVLVEKPLATTHAEGVALFGGAGGLVVMENRMFAHHRQHADVADLMPAIGSLRAVTAAMAIPPLPATDVRYRPELGGGALLDVGYYPLHAALMFAGADLEVVGATQTIHTGHEVDVGGTALLRAPDGVTAQVIFGFEHGYRSFYELWGTRGRITLERAFTPGETWRPTLRIERHGATEVRTLPPADQFRAAIEVFAGAVTGTWGLGAHTARTLAGLALIDAVRRATDSDATPLLGAPTLLGARG